MSIQQAPARSAGSTARLPFAPDRLWEIFSRRDARFDGRFFTAVRTTGIFCRPSCTCRKPRRENVVFYASAGAASVAGYRPCKRCRPDLKDGAAEEGRLLAARAIAIMRERMSERLTLAEIAREAGVSPYHFARRFRRADGRTPMRALADLRAERAEALMKRNGTGTLAAGYAAGFGSASSFERAFRRRTGLSPAAWRRAHDHREARRER